MFSGGILFHWCFTVVVLFSLTFATVSHALQGISERLQKELASKPDTSFLRVNAVFRDQLTLNELLKNVQGKPRREWRKINLPILRAHAERTQANVLRELRILEKNGEVKNIRINWMGNEINFEATIRELKTFYFRFPELKSLDWDPDYKIEEIIDVNPHRIVEPPQINTISWGVVDIQAPQIWAMGYTGQGILIANIDTGVERTHPALVSRIWNNEDEIPNNNIDDDQNGYIDDTWGWNFEQNNNNPIPGDSHGTRTAGIMVGASSTDTTGVAIGATMMVLRNSSEGGYRLCQQYAVANGADVISSSLSYKYINSPDYEQMRVMTDMELVNGVIHANSIGNQGNSLATYPIPFNIATPGNCPSPWLHPAQTLIGGISAVMACGAYEQTSYAANYTGRGPAAWDSIMSPSRPPLRVEYRDYPYRNGLFQGLLKPDVCMPTDVRTTNVNGSYVNVFSGTSASTPHLGGAMALLLSAVPDATPMEICEAIKMTADTTNIGLQHNLYGAGRVRLVPALNYLFSLVDCGVIRGIVRDSITNTAIANANLTISNSFYSTRTDSAGTFIFPRVRAGIWNIQVSAERYITRTLTNVEIDSGDTVVLNIALTSPRANLIVENLQFQLQQGDSIRFPLYIQNVGFDTLRWQLSVVRPDTNNAIDSVGYTILRIPVSSITGDNRIYGVEFAYNHIWLTGANNSSNPNYIYKLTRNGAIVDTIIQPMSNSINGIRDFAFDGTYFLGTDNNVIYRFDTTGTVIDSFATLVNPVSSIAYDPNQQLLYYCDTRTPIYVINLQGQLLRQLQNPFAITGLAWYATDPDSMPLYIFSQDSTPARLISKMNPYTGVTRSLFIPRANGGQTSGGLCIIPNWEFCSDVILAVSRSLNSADTLEVLQLRYHNVWLTFQRNVGTIYANQTDTLSAIIRSANMPIGVWQAGLRLTHNAPQPSLRHLITVTVTPSTDVKFTNQQLPKTFEVSNLYPNPFNSTAKLNIQLPHSDELKLFIYDINGREVFNKNFGVVQAGIMEIDINGNRLSSGVYFIRIQTSYSTALRKGVFIK